MKEKIQDFLDKHSNLDHKIHLLALRAKCVRLAFTTAKERQGVANVVYFNESNGIVHPEMRVLGWVLSRFGKNEIHNSVVDGQYAHKYFGTDWNSSCYGNKE